jgi:galactoside O-acetyltransferase
VLNGEFLSPAEVRALGFAALGENILIHPSCVLTGCERISLGSNLRIDPFCIITASASVSIGSYVHLSGHAVVVGRAEVRIGDYAAISHGAKLLSASDRFDGSGIAGPMAPDTYRDVIYAPIIIGRHVIVGANTIVLPGVTIGEGATVGALSIVKSDLAPWSVYAGAPARLIGTRDEQGVRAAERKLKSDDVG